MGIGRAIAARLAGGGASVVIAARRQPAIDETVAAIRAAGGEATGIAADVATAAGARALVDEAVARYGGVDILANCQGIQRYGTVEETDETLWDEVMRVNVTSMYLTARAAIPEMRRRGGGAIVNVSSVQGLATQTRVAAYSTSKAAIIGLTRTIAVDYAAEHIRANVVLPGSIDTPMLRHSADLFRAEGQGVDDLLADWGRMHALGRVGRPEEVAELVAFLAGDRASFLTGGEYKVDGGMMAALGVTLPEQG
jgi:NAD(P)-dependent dehydrogenase (short-subunit alcohol dehydrogenase family)